MRRTSTLTSGLMVVHFMIMVLEGGLEVGRRYRLRKRLGILIKAGTKVLLNLGCEKCTVKAGGSKGTPLTVVENSLLLDR